MPYDISIALLSIIGPFNLDYYSSPSTYLSFPVFSTTLHCSQAVLNSLLFILSIQHQHLTWHHQSCLWVSITIVFRQQAPLTLTPSSFSTSRKSYLLQPMSTTPSARTVSTSHHLALRDDPHLSRPFSRLAFRHRQLMIHAHITVEKRRLEGAIRTNTFNCLVDLSLALILLLSHNTTKAFLLFTSLSTPSISELSHNTHHLFLLSLLSLSLSLSRHLPSIIVVYRYRSYRREGLARSKSPKRRNSLSQTDVIYLSYPHHIAIIFTLSPSHGLQSSVCCTLQSNDVIVIYIPYST